MNLSNVREKEFWKKEMKKISFSDILIWIAIVLLFLASWQNIQAGNDPCSYCVINNLPMEEGAITCKEYFSRTEIDRTELNVSGIEIIDSQNENIAYGNP